MGRATIISGGLNGRYLIEMDYGLAVRNAKIAKLTSLLAELQTRKAWQQQHVEDLQEGLDSFGPEIDALINEYVALTKAVPRDQVALDAKKKQIDAKNALIVKQRIGVADATATLRATEGQIVSATAERAALNVMEITEQRGAWCTDFTETAAGPVATMEIPGESALILVAPGGRAPGPQDGALMAREIMSPEQAFWNAAVLPGWQKFKPTYRWGTITALDKDTDRASVALAPAKSSANTPKLNVNQAETLTNVPVVYMTCNAGAFEVGDRCVVRFENQDWASPKVVGFLDNPKPCVNGLHVLINLDIPLAGDYPPPTLINNEQRYMSLIYRLNALDPMDATKAVLIYRGASDRWHDYTGTTSTVEFLGEKVSRGYYANTVGYSNPYVWGAFVISGKLMTYELTGEGYSYINYPGSPPPYPDPYNYYGYGWETRQLRVTYDGKTGVMNHRTDTTIAEGSMEVTTVSVGSRPSSWPYYMDSRTIVDGATFKNIHIQGYTVGEAGYREFKWVTSADGEFVHDPAAGYLDALPSQASDYTYGQIGKREKGFDWIKYNDNLIDRRGDFIGTAHAGVVLGDVLSRGYYVGANGDGTFSIKRLSDDQRFGSRLVLGSLPDITDAPEYAAAIAAAGVFHYETPVDTTMQKCFADDYVSTGLRVTFIYDIAAQIDVTKEWAPRTDPE